MQKYKNFPKCTVQEANIEYYCTDESENDSNDSSPFLHLPVFWFIPFFGWESVGKQRSEKNWLKLFSFSSVLYVVYIEPFLQMVCIRSYTSKRQTLTNSSVINRLIVYLRSCSAPINQLRHQVGADILRKLFDKAWTKI